MDPLNRDKIDCMFDLQGDAHALLYLDYYRIYTTLLKAWYWPNKEEREQYLRAWYVDDRANPKLFWGLLAFAQPESFKTMYKRPESCFGILVEALRELYHEPHALGLANRELNARLNGDLGYSVE